MWKASICQSDFFPPLSPAILSSCCLSGIFCTLSSTGSHSSLFSVILCLLSSFHPVCFISLLVSFPVCLLFLLSLFHFLCVCPIASPHDAPFPSILYLPTLFSSYLTLSPSRLVFFFLCLLLLLCFSSLLFAVSSTYLMWLASFILMPKLSGVVSCDGSPVIGRGPPLQPDSAIVLVVDENRRTRGKSRENS